MSVHSIAVFCGSKNGNDPVFVQEAEILGDGLAKRGIELVYGGGNVGLMGAVANAVMNGGGSVVGVIPKVLSNQERSHKGITELLVVDDMHTRKRKMYELCDAAVILPGGYGTLDELFEMITWNNLSIHDKHIYLINLNGFYNPLLSHIENMLQQGFLYEDPMRRITVVGDIAALWHFDEFKMAAN